MLRLDMNLVTLATTSDSDSQIQHSLISLMQRQIHDFQDKLASFVAKTEKLKIDL